MATVAPSRPPPRPPTAPARAPRRWVRAALLGLAALATYVIAANTFVIARAAPHTFGADDVPSRSVAIVLGAKVAHGEPSAVLADRLQCAEELHRSGRVGKILVTGDRSSPGYDEPTVMAAWLRAHGVPDEDVLIDPAGFRTHDSMQRAAAVFGVKDAIVCTQAFHLSRAIVLARGFGIDAVGVPADRRPYRGARRFALRETISRAFAFAEQTALVRAVRRG